MSKREREREGEKEETYPDKQEKLMNVLILFFGHLFGINCHISGLILFYGVSF